MLLVAAFHMSAPPPPHDAPRSVPVSSHPPPPPPPSLSHLHAGVRLFLSNRFFELNSLFSLYAAADLPLANLTCWVRAVEAATNMKGDQLQATLNYVWDIEKRARHTPTRPAKANSSAAGLNPILIQLIQGDTLMIGSTLQLMLDSYLKAFYNLTRSWSSYSSALKAVQQAELAHSLTQTPDAESILQWNADKAELVELRSWAEFGCGLFNMLMSMLPPTVARIGSWVGLNGDRPLGMRLLTSSYQVPSIMGPLSAMLLANFSISSVTYMQEREEVYIPVVVDILSTLQRTHAESWLFEFLQSRFARHQRRLADAVRLSNSCITKASAGGMPAVATLLYINPGWCAFFMSDWQEAAGYLDKLLHAADHPAGSYDQTRDYVTDRTPWTPAQISQLNLTGTRLPASRANSQAFNSLLVAICHLHLYLQASHSTLHDNERSKSIVRDSDTDPDAPASAATIDPATSPQPSSAALPAASASVTPPPRAPAASSSPSPSSPPSSPSSASSHLNRAFWYIQNSLSLLDHKRYRPMDEYSNRKCLELLARPLDRFKDLLWNDTGELLLKWSGAQQMDATQIERILVQLRRLRKETPAYFTPEDRASTLLFLSNLLRGVDPASPEARGAMDEFEKYVPALQSSKRAQVDGTLCFGWYESAILYYHLGQLDAARADMKRSQAVKNFDQYNIMQVRNHALKRTLKAAIKQRESQL